MKKEDTQIWLKYITFNTNIMRKIMYEIVKDKKLSETDFNRLNLYLDSIDYTVSYIKDLAE